LEKIAFLTKNNARQIESTKKSFYVPMLSFQYLSSLGLNSDDRTFKAMDEFRRSQFQSNEMMAMDATKMMRLDSRKIIMV